MVYDKLNIFAKIINNQLESEKIYEDDRMIVITDKYPDAAWTTHLLVLPKKEFENLSDFVSSGDQELISNFFSKIDEIAKKLGLNSYQLSTNNGSNAGQEIMHFHIHLKSNDEVILK